MTYRLLLGSSASRSPSPNKLKAVREADPAERAVRAAEGRVDQVRVADVRALYYVRPDYRHRTIKTIKTPPPIATLSRRSRIHVICPCERLSMSGIANYLEDRLRVGFRRHFQRRSHGRRLS